MSTRKPPRRKKATPKPTRKPRAKSAKAAGKGTPTAARKVAAKAPKKPAAKTPPKAARKVAAKAPKKPAAKTPPKATKRPAPKEADKPAATDAREASPKPAKKTKRATGTAPPRRAGRTVGVGEAYATALRHYHAGRLAAADALCRKILAAAPAHFDSLFLLGGIATRAGNPGRAAEAFGRAVAADPDHADARVNLGIALRALGRRDAAEASFRQALAIDPEHAEAHCHLGRILRDKGDVDGAIACFRHAIRRKPDYPEALNSLGLELSIREEIEEAEACYLRAIELAPDFADAHNNLGNLRRYENDMEAAAACYRRVVELAPRLPAGHTNLGKALRGLGRLDEAEACFRHAAELDPRFAEAHRRLGDLLARRGRPADAEACYRRALEIDPGAAMTWHILGGVLKDQDKLDDAVASYERALAIDPEAADTLNSLGIVKKQQHKVDEAVACYRRAIDLRPDNAEAYNNLGNALKDMGRWDESVAAYRSAIASRDNFAEAYCNLAKVHTFAPGDPDLQVLKDLYARDDVPAETRTHLLTALAKAHEDIGAYDAAFDYCTRANASIRAERPYNPDAHRRRVKQVKRLFRDPPPAPPRPAADPRVPVFAVGMSRSGKSLVESFLARHPDVHAAGESRAWTDALRTVLDRHGIRSEYPEFMEAVGDAEIAEIGVAYLDAVSALAPGARCVVNTMPSNYPYVGLIVRALPAARIVYTYRDPMDNCVSSYFYRYRAGNAYSNDLRTVGLFYADYQDIMTHWLRLFRDRILPVRYETLVRRPERAVPRIFGFCGLDFDPAYLDVELTTDEIGRWRRYEAHLDPLREALGKWIRLSAAGLPEES